MPIGPVVVLVKRLIPLLLIAAGGCAPAPNPDEFRLVGWGCEGAGDKPLFRNEEDEFPRCKEIIVLS